MGSKGFCSGRKDMRVHASFFILSGTVKVQPRLLQPPPPKSSWPRRRAEVNAKKSDPNQGQEKRPVQDTSCRAAATPAKKCGKKKPRRGVKRFDLLSWLGVADAVRTRVMAEGEGVFSSSSGAGERASTDGRNCNE
eukprot:1137855-Pelagomonas_calceolata.AAC.1